MDNPAAPLVLTIGQAAEHPMGPSERTVMSNVIDLADRHPERAARARATYTVPEVAALLGMSRANTYALLAAGEIPARRLGSRWVIARHRFHQWLDSDPDLTDGATR